MEAAHRSTSGTDAPKRCHALARAAEEIAQRLDSPYLHGMIAMKQADARVPHAGPVEAGPDVARPGRAALPQPLHGRHLGARYRPHLRAVGTHAKGRNGRAESPLEPLLFPENRRNEATFYAATMLSTFFMTIIKLAKNDHVESQHRETRRSRQRTANAGSTLQHASTVESLIHLDLYRGDINSAWARVGSIWPEYSQSMLLRIQLIRIHMHELRARTALAMAERTNDAGSFIRQITDDALGS